MPLMPLDHAHWTQLEQVQLKVNARVAFASDLEAWGKPGDYWEPAVGRGDCEDIALAKRKRLIDQGWPADSLRIAVVTDEHGQLHAVLTVDVATANDQAATYVLDNRFVHVEPWRRLSDLGYHWIERAKPGSTAWVRLDDGRGAANGAG